MKRNLAGNRPTQTSENWFHSKEKGTPKFHQTYGFWSSIICIFLRHPKILVIIYFTIILKCITNPPLPLLNKKKSIQDSSVWILPPETRFPSIAPKIIWVLVTWTALLKSNSIWGHLNYHLRPRKEKITHSNNIPDKRSVHDVKKISQKLSVNFAIISNIVLSVISKFIQLENSLCIWEISFEISKRINRYRVMRTAIRIIALQSESAR